MPENFISTFTKHTSIYESPGSFWKWAAYAAIAGVLRDHCYLKQGDRLLFGNIYVLFLAESGGRKGPPIDLAETLINKINEINKTNNIKIISGRSSAPAILDELARAETDKNTGKVCKTGSAIFFAQELDAAIVADKQGLGIFTDIYDYKTNPYKHRLRTGPCFNLDRIVFSMLSGSNEAMLQGVINDKEIQGGFLARTFLVTANEQRPPNSLMRLDYDERKESIKKVLQSFLEVSKLNGIFTLEEDAIKEYEAWYTPFKISYQNRKETTGVVARLHTGIIKVAMLLAANNLRLNICKCDMEQAIEECLALIPNYNTFVMNNHQKTDLKTTGNLLIVHLLEKRFFKDNRKFIIRDNWQKGLDPELLDKAASMLETAGMIRIHLTNEGTLYELTATALEMLGKKVEVVK